MSAVSVALCELLWALGEACNRSGVCGQRAGVNCPDGEAPKGEPGKNRHLGPIQVATTKRRSRCLILQTYPGC